MLQQEDCFDKNNMHMDKQKCTSILKTDQTFKKKKKGQMQQMYVLSFVLLSVYLLSSLCNFSLKYFQNHH